mmetsp:Transcript_11375/g.17107  ORF Transcript_11375/g.17107 Transcript_11375/m.17107 type:complete len:276 (+) Transcript_11375:19-846(+)
MANNCSHHDSSRKGVSSTAHLVAKIRASETSLFNDPFGDILGGEIGEKFIEKIRCDSGETKLTELAALISVRTKFIDDEILKAIKNEFGGILPQVVTLGAGLDTRAWRLKFSNIYFEVDFKEIFDFKLQMLPLDLVPSYKAVVADLSLPSWPECLIAAGCDVEKPIVWLLEGLTGYLTDSELETLLTTISRLSVNGSRFIATFLTSPSKNATTMDLHRSHTPEPLALIKRLDAGWIGEQHDIDDIAESLGRCIIQNKEDPRIGYAIVIATMLRSP